MATGESQIEDVDSVCILHDRLVNQGGAEQVAFEMARALDAPIYAGIVDDEIVPDDVKAIEVFTSPVGQWAMDSHPFIQDAYQMIGWQHVESIYDYDIVVINKTNPGWFVPKDTQTTVWYVHSTPRGLYDQFHRKGKHWVTRLIKTPMRPLYSPNTRYADAWVCNSELVERRLIRYWDIDKENIRVLYPPVDTQTPKSQINQGRDGFVTVGRLTSHKNTASIVEACNSLQLQLTVAGDGPQRESLEDFAGPTVDIAGYVSEDRKYELLAGAEAFIFAADNEDFGISPIEAMAVGTPVIGLEDGYTQHQVIDGKNGFLYEEGKLMDALIQFREKSVEWDSDSISSWTERFDTREFHRGIREEVRKASVNSRVIAPWEELKAGWGDQ